MKEKTFLLARQTVSIIAAIKISNILIHLSSWQSEALSLTLQKNKIGEMKKKLFISIALLILSLQLIGIEAYLPDTLAAKKQNYIHLTASIPIISGYYILKYERALFMGDSGAASITMGLGGWSNWDNAGNLGMFTANYIVGKGRHFFESNIGLIYHNDKSDFVKIKPLQLYLNAGYRNQKRGKPYFFRIGYGLPLRLNFGFGFAF
jgi:hypothetical protein